VTTKLGMARGFLFMPRGFEGVEVFLAIPYASPPLGSLRLMPPVSGSPWSGTKMNEEPSPVCPQVFPLHQHTSYNNYRNNNANKMSESVSSSESDDGESLGDEDVAGSSRSSLGSGSGSGSELNETEILKRMPRGKLAQLKRLAPFLKNQSEDCLYLNIYVPLSGYKWNSFLN
jgi:neuroligin